MNLGNYNGHGHVRIHPEGKRARCGGPAGFCLVCQKELIQLLLREGEEINIQSCARCGKNHRTKFKLLETPCLDFTHWGLCPINYEPILMKIIKTQETDIG